MARRVGRRHSRSGARRVPSIGRPGWRDTDRSRISRRAADRRVIGRRCSGRCGWCGRLDVEVAFAALTVDRLGALGQGDRGVGRGVAHLIESCSAEIVDVVARQVVAGVVLGTYDPAVDGGFFGGLDAFGAGEQSAGRDVGFEERSIVRSSVERGFGGQTLAGEVVEEELFDLG